MDFFSRTLHVLLMACVASTAATQRSIFSVKYLNDSTSLKPAYDYIIVGGGTSGLTVADRLTEDELRTVLVIENGPLGMLPDPSSKLGKTAMLNKALADSPLIDQVRGGFSGMGAGFLYNIISMPQVNLNNRSFPVLAGNLVGGSSAVNAMMTVRGTSEDYDRWGSFFGSDSSWNWLGLLPYFRKALTLDVPNSQVAEQFNIAIDRDFWGNTSHIHAGWPSFQYPGLIPQIDAFRDIPGIEFPTDSGAGRAGVYWFPSFMDQKTVNRSYARNGHYDGIERANYDLIANSKVTRVLLQGRKAIGVSFKRMVKNSTTEHIIKANREIIMAAGAVHTPQILQLSGIGPKKLLASAGIEVAMDLPGVGQNFQDHPMLSAMILLSNFTVHPDPSDIFTNTNFSDWAEEVWRYNRTGPNSLGIGNMAAWLPMPVISPDVHERIAGKLEGQNYSSLLPPDSDIAVIAGYNAQMHALASAIRSNNTAYYSISLSGSAAPGGASILLHPLSRGTVNIDPKNPNATEPQVDYRALSNPIDIDILVEFIKFTRRYHFNTSLAAYKPVEVLPGSKVVRDEDLAAYVRRAITPSEYHPSGTCAMMPLELGGVVDEDLKVYGMEGLRIVDASIMPTLPGANTCQTVYAVAEKFGPPTSSNQVTESV